MTTTTRLLGHLAWLQENLQQTPDAELAAYNAALRLRAETIKDRVSDAILPKTVRRELRAHVDKLVDASREARAATERGQHGATDQGKYFVLIVKKLATVTRFGRQAKLFDGQVVEWKAASKPISFSELMAFISSPYKDRSPAAKLAPEYRKRLAGAVKTLMAATVAQATAESAGEKKLAAEIHGVGAAMLAHASDGVPASRADRRQDEALAAMISGDSRSRRRPSK
jgi:hypothetical protein